ncbi:hypothetical protein PG996_000491 [Apiospora saccharicola]|uniref:Uncharacterized protein n=1 Tax=Apiospora saccharicola TaxID=335842 RepID=A0ABR1WGV5_9PEZI
MWNRRRINRLHPQIRLLNFPENIKTTIRQIVASSGHTSVQNERESYYHGSYELKMRGYPWRASGNDVVHSRRLINRNVEDLFDMGWLLTVSTDINKAAEDVNTLIVRHHHLPSPREWLAVSFSNGDKLRLIGAPPW